MFPIADALRTLKCVTEQQAKNAVRGHGLRDTFASIVEKLMSGAVLKKMLNHSAAGDLDRASAVTKLMS
jgi:arsenate reductase-like glutaredoxin family protein